MNDKVDELIQVLTAIEKEPEKWDVATKANIFYKVREALQIAIRIKEELKKKELEE